MARVDKVAEALSELAATKSRPRDAPGVAAIRKHLGSKQAMVVLKAAEAAGRWGVREALPEMLEAFTRLMSSSDPGCEAKATIAKSIVESDFGPVTGGDEVSELFEKGITHVQWEAVWGDPPRVDVAAGLRGWCALGLSSTGHRDQVRLIIPLLADPESHARSMAVRALTQGGSEAAEALLRFKVLSGDNEDEVLSEALSGLAAGWPGRSVGFIAGQLASDRLRPYAALALGECRDVSGVRRLIELYREEISPRRLQDLLPGLVVSRHGEALAFLLEQLGSAPMGKAAAILEALAPRRPYADLWGKVAAAVEGRGDSGLRAVLAKVSR